MPLRVPAGRAAVFALACLVVTTACGGEAPPPPNPADLVISNGRLVDGSGTTFAAGSVEVRGGRITAVSDGAPAAPGVTEIDAQGMTVMPGLIDTHVHLLLVDRTLENEEALDQWISQELPGDLMAYLDRGFTTILSTGDHLGPILRVRERIRIGALTGPRLFAAGPVFTAPGGHPAVTVCGDMPSLCRDSITVEVEDATTARQQVRQLAAIGVDAIKAVYSEQAMGDAVPKLADDVLAAIGEEAAQRGIPLIVHATQAADAPRAVELGTTRFVHPPVHGTADLSSVIESLTGAGVAVSTTSFLLAPRAGDGGEMQDFMGQPYSPEMEALLSTHLAGVRGLWDGGVVVAFGTDRWQGDPADAISGEMDALSQVLSPEEIVTALTRNAAAFLGLGSEIGTLEVGKRADIVIVDGNPLADVSALANVQLVIKDGRILVDHRNGN